MMQGSRELLTAGGLLLAVIVVGWSVWPTFPPLLKQGALASMVLGAVLLAWKAKQER